MREAARLFDQVMGSETSLFYDVGSRIAASSVAGGSTSNNGFDGGLASVCRIKRYRRPEWSVRIVHRFFDFVCCFDRWGERFVILCAKGMQSRSMFPLPFTRPLIFLFRGFLRICWTSPSRNAHRFEKRELKRFWPYALIKANKSQLADTRSKKEVTQSGFRICEADRLQIDYDISGVGPCRFYRFSDKAIITVSLYRFVDQIGGCIDFDFEGWRACTFCLFHRWLLQAVAAFFRGWSPCGKNAATFLMRPHFYVNGKILAFSQGQV